MGDYTSKIKEICDTLGSIDFMVEDDEMVQICLGGLLQKYGSFRTAICMREKPPSSSMLLVEENHAKATRIVPDESQMVYSESVGNQGWGCGHGWRGRMGRWNGGRKTQWTNNAQVWRGNGRPFLRRGATEEPKAVETTRLLADIVECKATKEENFYKKQSDQDQQRTHFSCTSDHGKLDPAFVMRHCKNSMEASTSQQDEVWYVDSGGSNHMTRDSSPSCVNQSGLGM